MSMIVHDLRLACIWTRAGAPDLPLLLRSREHYEAAFDRARHGGGTWTLPWRADDPDRNRFWRTYLERATLQSVSGEQAWRHLMPLRAQPLVQIVPQDLAPTARPVQSAVAGLGYPHGAGVIVMLTFRTSSPLEEMVDTVIAARQSRYQVTWLRDGSQQVLSLDDLATRLLNRLLEELAGHADVPPIRTGEPLTVATVIDGSGVDPTHDLTPGDALHHALAGLATLHPRWKRHPRIPLDTTTRLPIKENQLDRGDLLYATETSRVIWFPSYFRENLYAQRRCYHLGHYHRNITLATMQTSSLLDLIRRAVATLDRYPQQPLDLEESARVKYAAGLLGRLYGGRGAYATWAVRHQIAPYADLVSRIRQGLLGWPALQ
jgi:hypothetical protein